MDAERVESWAGLIEPAFTAAHRALVRLDDADVPAGLRPVRAASKKKTLPKHLRRKLVDVLEEDWLRNLATAEMGSGETTAEVASRLFLSRPDGWESQLDGLAAHQHEKRLRHEMDALVADNARLETLAAELGERVQRAEAVVEDLQARLGSDERLESMRKRFEETSRSVVRLEGVIEARSGEMERLRAELAEADERIGVLRSRVSKDSVAARPSEGSRTFGRGHPIETARLLDELSEALRPRPGEVHGPVELAPLALPAGIRPDSDEAIDWIRSVTRKVLLIVDGHNVAHDLDSEPGRTARDRVVSEVARLRRLSDGPLSAVVYFDTGQEAETHQNFGVTVRYVPDADSAIEATVAATDVDCIVISTDREVRNRSAAHGALTLWGTAFSTWIKRR